VAARLLATRLPAAVVTDRRRRARTAAGTRGSTPSHAPLTLWAWTRFITHGPGTGWTPETLGKAYPFRGHVERICKSWKSDLPLATRTTKKAEPPVCYLSGRLLLSFLTDALSPSLRAAWWEKKRRELRLLNLVRPLQAVADRWLQGLFQAEGALRRFLHHAWATAERLVAQASSKRRPSAQILRESLHTQNDFIEFTEALAA